MNLDERTCDCRQGIDGHGGSSRDRKRMSPCQTDRFVIRSCIHDHLAIRRRSRKRRIHRREGRHAKNRWLIQRRPQIAIRDHRSRSQAGPRCTRYVNNARCGRFNEHHIVPVAAVVKQLEGVRTDRHSGTVCRQSTPICRGLVCRARVIDQRQNLIHARRRRIQRIQHRQCRATQVEIATYSKLRVVGTGCRPATVDRELNRSAGCQIAGNRHLARCQRPQIRHIPRDRS